MGISRWVTACYVVAFQHVANARNARISGMAIAKPKKAAGALVTRLVACSRNLCVFHTLIIRAISCLRHAHVTALRRTSTSCWPTLFPHPMRSGWWMVTWQTGRLSLSLELDQLELQLYLRPLQCINPKQLLLLISTRRDWIMQKNGCNTHHLCHER